MSRRATAAALLLVAFALRVFRLGDANVWWDEALAVWAVRKTFVGTTLWTAADVHPPLFFWLQWPWLRLAGQTEFAVRVIPTFTGVIAAALAYALGRRLGGPRAGVIALTFVALARFEVWWSMELRMYVLAGTAILATTYAAARWLRAQEQDAGSTYSARRWLIAYVLSATCALYTIYMAVVAVAALALSGLVILGWLARRSSPGQRSVAPARLVVWIAAQAAVIALMLPWLALALPRMQSWSSLRDTPASMSFVFRLWGTLLATGVSTAIETANTWTAVFWACVLVVPVVVALVWRRHDAEHGGKPASLTTSSVGAWLLLGPFVIVPPLAVWAATQPRSLFYSPSVEARYLLPFAGPVYVLAAVMLGRAWDRSRLVGLSLAIGALAALVVYLPDHYAPRRLRDEMQSMTLAIWSQAEPGDAVVLLSGNRYPMFLYYYDQPWDVNHASEPYVWPTEAPPRWSERPSVIPFPNRSMDVVAGLDWEAELDKIVATHDRVWLAEIESHLQDPNDEVEAWLNDKLPRVLSEGYGPNALHLYDPDGADPQVTGVSSYWPFTRELVYPICKTGDSPVGFDCNASLLRTYHKVAGAPVRTAMPGDLPGFTLFELERPAGAAVDALVSKDTLTLWSLPEHLRRMPTWSAAWSQAWAPSPTDTSPPRRQLTQIPVSDRFPSGAGIVHAHGLGRVIAPLSVRGSWPHLSSLRDVRADFGFVWLNDSATSGYDIRPDRQLVVDLYWRHPDDVRGYLPPSRTFPERPPTVFVHLLGPPRPDTGDRVWAAHDGEPSSGPWLTQALRVAYDRHILVVPSDAPPGEYELVTGLYDPASMERHAVEGTDADETARHARIGTITVK